MASECMARQRGTGSKTGKTRGGFAADGDALLFENEMKALPDDPGRAFFWLSSLAALFGQRS